MSGDRLTSPIYSHRGRQDADPASIALLARKFWCDEGGVLLAAEDVSAAPEAVRDWLTSFATRRHGSRRERKRG